jgi:hypothetical protein
MSNLNSLANIDFENNSVIFASHKSSESEQKILDKSYHFEYLNNISSGYYQNDFYVSSATQAISHSGLKSEAEKRAVYLVNLTSKDEFIEGETSTTELYLTSLYKENPAIFAESFQKTWLKLYELADAEILANFISIISAIDYEWLTDKADALVLGGCSHVDPYVNEATLRAIEAWEEPKHIVYLSNIRAFDINWLEDYRKEVVNYIERMQ